MIKITQIKGRRHFGAQAAWLFVQLLVVLFDLNEINISPFIDFLQ